MSFPLYIGNDHTIRLAGLRKESDWQFVTSGATVQVTLYDGLSATKTEVSGQTWPATMSYVSPGTNTVGGEESGPTVVKSVDGLDITVTVGTTNGLDLSEGAIVEALHDEKNKWKVVENVTATAGSDAVIHVEPLIWSSSTEPRSINLTEGEILILTDGVYEARLQETISIENRSKYYGEITATHSTFGKGVWQVELKAEYRVVK